MGNCVGPEGVAPDEMGDYKIESAADKKIQLALEAAQRDDREWVKLLLLGTGDSGKSTLFKQIVYLYDERNAFNEEARRPFASVIFGNVVGAIQELIRQSDLLPKELGCQISPHLQGSKNFLLHNVPEDGRVTPEVAHHVALLWADDGCRRTYNCRARFQLSDSCRYFFQKVDELARPDYIPSYQDVLQCRSRTVGIVETEFRLTGVPFRMVDVGGQRNERRKWIHCFDGVTAVIFVAAVNVSALSGCVASRADLSSRAWSLTVASDRNTTKCCTNTQRRTESKKPSICLRRFATPSGSTTRP